MARHRRLGLILLILAAVGLRAAYFTQLTSSSLIDMHQWDQSDMHYYDTWAREVAAGDWLSRRLAPPVHAWHRQVADEYLRSHPQSSTGSPDIAASLWAGWMGAPRFYQDPLYAYGLAFIYRVSASARLAIALQLACGVLTVVLIWLLARRYFGDATAMTAAAMALLCAPLLFYEGLLLRDSSISLAGLFIVWVMGAVVRRPSEAGMRAAALPFLLGLCCGIAWVLKSTFVLLAAGAVVGLVVWYRRQPRVALSVTGAIAIGFASGMVPLAARNAAVGVAPISLAASGPLTLVTANGETANPDMGWEVDTPQLAAFFGGTDGGLVAAVQTTLEAHTPGSFARLMWRKWDRTWHWFEIPNNENFYYARRHVPILAWLPLTFWAIAPLALVGLFLGVPRFREAWPLYLLVAFSAASVVVFVVIGRLRLPLVTALMPFAALTVVEAVRLTRERRIAATLALIVAVVAAGAWTGRPRASDQLDIRTADWLLPFSVHYEHRVNDAIERKDWAGAAAVYREYFVQAAPTAADIAAAEDSTLAPTVARMHAIRASLLARAGEDPLSEIGDAEALLGKSTAREEIDRATAILDDARRQYAGAMSRLGVERAGAGRMDEAVAAFRRVVAVDGRNSHAHYNLARALAVQGSLAEALSEAQRAAILAPGDPAPRALAAELAAALKGR